MTTPNTTDAGPGGAPDDRSDEAVLKAAAAGDAEGIATLYERYASMAHGLALRITGDTTLAQDVVQEAFVGVWRNAARYASDKGSVRTWILAIAHHRAVDAVRRRRPTTDLPEGESAPTPAFVIPDVWHEVAGRLDRDDVVRALSSLSDPQREALELAYFGGLTQQEIAARTATPLGTVKSRVRLGLIAMRAALVSAGAGAGDAAGDAPGASSGANLQTERGR